MPPSALRRIEHCGEAYRQRTSGRVVLMTATLVPPSAAVARSDPTMRLRDYCDALSFYLTLPAAGFDRIIFADNSDSDLTPVLAVVQRENVDKRVELLSFQGNEHDPTLGKAYGEFRIIDTVVEASTILSSEDHVWKTTGRLRCLNLPALDQASSPDDEFVCDLYNLPFIRSGRWSDRGRMELRLFRFRPRAYDRWIRSTQRNGPEAFDESFLYRVMLQARKEDTLRPRFPIQPAIAGVSGRTQRDYRSTSQRLKDALRGTTRLLVPWLWL
jgi:hypothetical protein